MLVPLLSVVVLFSTMMTIGDFDIVYVLTGGGPFDTTHLLATLAYTRAIGVGQIGMGASISLFMFPFLFIIAFLMLRNIRRKIT